MVIREIIRPLATRMGSVFAGALIAFQTVGPDGPTVTLDQLGTAITVLMLFAADLVGSYWTRRN